MKTTSNAGGFHFLYSFDVRCVEPFWAFCDVKGDFVAFAKVIETYSAEFIGVEKEIFFFTLSGDKSESSVRHQSSDCSCIHQCKNQLIKTQTQESAKCKTRLCSS